MTSLRPLPVLLILALAGCTWAGRPLSTPPASEADDLTRAAIGQTITVGGPRVTPLALLEDSRCPAKARCVWAGRVRLSVRVALGSGTQVLELIQGEPARVADGTLELVEVAPAKPSTGSEPIDSSEYRFGFRFRGGL